jgi:hypothetical protein
MVLFDDIDPMRSRRVNLIYNVLGTRDEESKGRPNGFVNVTYAMRSTRVDLVNHVLGTRDEESKGRPNGFANVTDAMRSGRVESVRCL